MDEFWCFVVKSGENPVRNHKFERLAERCTKANTITQLMTKDE